MCGVRPLVAKYHLLRLKPLIGAGANVESRTNVGETPLELAKQHFGYPELAEMLIRYGAT